MAYYISSKWVYWLGLGLIFSSWFLTCLVKRKNLIQRIYAVDRPRELWWRCSCLWSKWKAFVKLSNYKLTQWTILILRVSTQVWVLFWSFLAYFLGEGVVWFCLGFFCLFVCISTEFLTEASKSSPRKFKAIVDHELSAHCYGLSFYLKKQNLCQAQNNLKLFGRGYFLFYCQVIWKMFSILIWGQRQIDQLRFLVFL